MMKALLIKECLKLISQKTPFIFDFQEEDIKKDLNKLNITQIKNIIESLKTKEV